MDPMTKKVDPSYYLNYEMDSVASFLKKRFAVHNRIYMDFIKYRDDYFPSDIDSMKKDEKRLDSEIRFLESIVSAYPFMKEHTDKYLPDLLKLKKKYQSLHKRAVNALENREKEEEKEF